MDYQTSTGHGSSYKVWHKILRCSGLYCTPPSAFGNPQRLWGTTFEGYGMHYTASEWPREGVANVILGVWIALHNPYVIGTLHV